MTTAMLEAALAYAELGWQVLPLHEVSGGVCTCEKGAACKSPGKHPRTVHGVKSATDDSELITVWWTKWPTANIGLAMGPGAGVWTIDVDLEFNPDTGEITKDGAASLQTKLGELGVTLPETIAAETGGGGRHLLFAWDDDVPIGCPKSGMHGVDIRGDGGFIVAPPSVHCSGRPYAWIPGHSPRDLDAQVCPAPLVRDVLSSHGGAARVAEAIAEQVSTGTSLGQPVPAELAAALWAIPASCDRDVWVQCGMAVHDATGGSQAGYEAWHAWSATGGEKYAGEQDCSTVWRSFKGRGNPVGPRTVYALAYAAGWQPPPHILADGNVLGPPAATPLAPPPLETPWPDLPQPLFNESDAPHMDTAELFPPSLAGVRSYFDKVAEVYQTPPDLGVLLGAPIAMAALSGKAEVLVPETDWREPAVLWTLVAMTSGSRKSAVHRTLLKPVEAWERDPAQAKATAEHIARIATAEASVRALTTRLSKGRAAENETQRAAITEEIAQANMQLELLKATGAPASRLVVQDATSEALLRRLQVQAGRALVSDAEGDVFDTAMGRYGNGAPANLGPWLKGYDGDRVVQERVAELRVVERALVNVGVATQPEALTFMGSRMANGRGFVARFCAAIVPGVPQSFIQRARVRASDRAPWDEAVGRLLNAPMPNEPRTLELSDGAMDVFEAWGSAHAVQQPGPEGTDPWRAKLGGKVLRLALLLHGLHEGWDMLDSIGVPCMQAACRWGDYLLAQQAAIAPRLDEGALEAQRVLAWLERRGAWGTVIRRRELFQGLKTTRLRAVDDLSPALALLVEAGWLRPAGKQARTAPGGAVPAWTKYSTHPSGQAALAAHSAPRGAEGAS